MTTARLLFLRVSFERVSFGHCIYCVESPDTRFRDKKQIRSSTDRNKKHEQRTTRRNSILTLSIRSTHSIIYFLFFFLTRRGAVHLYKWLILRLDAVFFFNRLITASRLLFSSAIRDPVLLIRRQKRTAKKKKIQTFDIHINKIIRTYFVIYIYFIFFYSIINVYTHVDDDNNT